MNRSENALILPGRAHSRPGLFVSLTPSHAHNARLEEPRLD
jgi:hypothetical protein